MILGKMIGVGMKVVQIELLIIAEKIMTIITILPLNLIEIQ